MMGKRGRPFRMAYAERWFEGERPPVWFVGNGCTCAPDRAVNGADLRAACRWHDWAYCSGGTEAERAAADRAFRWNLLCCGCPVLTRWLYFVAVRWCAADAWPYADPSERPRLRTWVWRAWDRMRGGGR
jgi:hypothetical protein